ncbi:hypothetical protein ACOMHN_021327 [Nucella lapillus]
MLSKGTSGVLVPQGLVPRNKEKGVCDRALLVPPKNRGEDFGDCAPGIVPDALCPGNNEDTFSTVPQALCPGNTGPTEISVHP